MKLIYSTRFIASKAYLLGSLTLLDDWLKEIDLSLLAGQVYYYFLHITTTLGPEAHLVFTAWVCIGGLWTFIAFMVSQHFSYVSLKLTLFIKMLVHNIQHFVLSHQVNQKKLIQCLQLIVFGLRYLEQPSQTFVPLVGMWTSSIGIIGLAFKSKSL